MTQVVKVRNMMRLIAATSAALMAMSAGQAFASVNVDGHNSETGPFAETENHFDIDHDFDIDIDNDADLDTDVEVDLNTGDNETKWNTDGGETETGDAVVDIAFDNEANENAGEVVIPDDLFDVDADFSNEETGPWSSNKNDLDLDTDVDIDVNNDADIKNDVDIDLNTGRNEVKGNTDGGELTTGKATVIIESTNKANTGGSSLDLSNLGGGVDADFSNEETGPESENYNKLDIDQNLNVDIKNDADINNDFKIDANTGENTVKDNTDAGGTHTGDAGVRIRVENVAN
jgi:hypothetical protein